MYPKKGDNTAQSPAAYRKTDVLREQLTDDTRPSCPKRKAETDFGRSSGGARQQQTGHIAGRNQQK
jgi:hypothetical protein